VQRLIRGRENRGNVLLGANQSGDSQARGHFPVRPLRFLDGGTDSLGRRSSSVSIETRQENQELFASISADQVAIPNRLPKDPGECFQHLVAREMTEVVVVSFEMIDIEKDQRQR